MLYIATMLIAALFLILIIKIIPYLIMICSFSITKIKDKSNKLYYNKKIFPYVKKIKIWIPIFSLIFILLYLIYYRPMDFEKVVKEDLQNPTNCSYTLRLFQLNEEDSISITGDDETFKEITNILSNYKYRKNYLKSKFFWESGTVINDDFIDIKLNIDGNVKMMTLMNNRKYIWYEIGTIPINGIIKFNKQAYTILVDDKNELYDKLYDIIKNNQL